MILYFEMERGVSDKNILDEFAICFCQVLEKHVKYIVVSGFVVISHGRRRSTEDIDTIIEKIPFENFKALDKDLDKAGFHCLQSTKVEDIYDYLIKGDSVRYVWKNTFLPPEMEIKFVKDEIDEMQMRTRVKLSLTGLDIWFSSVEFNIAFKEELLKSDKDMEDAFHLRLIYKDEINETFINEIKKMIKKLRVPK